MKFLPGLLIACCFFYSCSSGDKIPSNVMQPAQLQEVMWDLLRAQELAQHRSLEDTVVRISEIHTDLYDKVFAIHGTSKKDFKSSLHFYQSRPDLLKPIFDTLNSRSENLVQLAQPQ
jgi:hypothetical protein